MRSMDRIAPENGCAGLVREHDSGAVNLHGSADLVGWASQVLINL
jgi:hypothetical protein